MANVGRHVFGLAAIALGAVGIAWDDFAAVWQPVPAEFPARALLAYAAAGAFVAAGLALQAKRTTWLGALIAGVLYAIFASLWGARIAAAPQLLATWSGFCEQFALVVAAIVAYASVQPESVRWSGRTILICRWAFALCLIAFGAAHFTYVEETAAMAPSWLPPSPRFWALATGSAHIAAGLGLLSGVLTLLAARLVTVMFVVFAALVWAPILLSAPGAHMSWAGNAINLALVGAAWVMADAIKAQRLAPEQH